MEFLSLQPTLAVSLLEEGVGERPTGLITVNEWRGAPGSQTPVPEPGEIRLLAQGRENRNGGTESRVKQQDTDMAK